MWDRVPKRACGAAMAQIFRKVCAQRSKSKRQSAGCRRNKFGPQSLCLRRKHSATFFSPETFWGTVLLNAPCIIVPDMQNKSTGQPTLCTCYQHFSTFGGILKEKAQISSSVRPLWAGGLLRGRRPPGGLMSPSALVRASADPASGLFETLMWDFLIVAPRSV